MNKRGQFYLVAILIIVSVFVGFVSITNKINVKHNEPFFEIGEELKIERTALLDHIFYNDLNPAQTQTVFENFSDLYILKVGGEKNSVFIYGDSTSINFNGNHVDDTEIEYNCGSTIQRINTVGKFTFSCSPAENNVSIYVEGQRYEFEIYPGQNIYYLISYLYDNERFTIYD